MTPQNEVKGFVLCNTDFPETMQTKLRDDGWQPVPVPWCNAVHPALGGHPDLQLCVVDEREVVVYPDMPDSFLRVLHTIFDRVVIGNTRMKPDYPHDIPYNGATAGSTFFHRIDRTDPVLMKRITLAGLDIAHVNQGYTGCSTLVIADDALITADEGIADEAIGLDFDVLRISPGHINLPGMNYGFIGGTAGWDKDQTVYFSGTVNEHPDAQALCDFLKNHSRTAVFLSDTALTDYGSLIFVPKKAVMKS